MGYYKKILITFLTIFVIAFLLSASWCIIYFEQFNTIVTYKTYSNNTNYVYYSTVEGDYKIDDFNEAKGAWTLTDLENFTMSSTPNFFGQFQPSIKNQEFESLDFSFNSSDNFHIKNYASSSNQTMIVQTNPAKGYSSVSTVNLNTLGIESKMSFTDRTSALTAVYLPNDGMNETGLTVSLQFGDEPIDYTIENTTRTDVTETVLVRMILDNASTVEEAIEVINEYDLFLTQNRHISLFITDSTGKSINVTSYVLTYIDLAFLRLEVETLDNNSLTLDDAMNKINDFTSTNENYSSNYKVLYNSTTKEVQYFLFGNTKSEVTIKL